LTFDEHDGIPVKLNTTSRSHFFKSKL